MSRARYIAVVGPGESATDAECAMAREIGHLLAEQQAIVVTGGLGGVMAAAAAGCRDTGGISVALLPGSERGNGESTVEIATGLGEMRNALIVRTADAVIAVGGSWGTLSEIALARRTAVPVVAIGGWSVTDADATAVPIETAATPAEAVARALSVAAAR